MSYDFDFRFRRALAPEGLITFATCMAALNDASADAKAAGTDPADDPAVQLFARRLARITDGSLHDIHAQDDDLKAACLERIAELKDKPAIVALLLRQMSYLPRDIAAYRREGQRALCEIAVALGMDRSQFRIAYIAPNPSFVGDHELTGRDIFIRLSVERFGSPAISYRHPLWQGAGAKVRHARATELHDIPALARKIAANLALPAVSAQPQV